MINVNKFERLRRSFKVIHLRLDNRHRLIHLFIHLLFSVVLILSFSGGLSHRPAEQRLVAAAPASFLSAFMFIKDCTVGCV